MTSPRFQNTLKKMPQPTPPIWMMRQAGRYHSHYQKLREKHGFMDLCKVPELAAEVALGPVLDFDFDVAILFSDLLFPLEALGMGLVYDPGPILDRKLTEENLPGLRGIDEAVSGLEFQREAMRLTRERLPRDKSLIGFVGGPWTLFSYATGGSHDGNLIAAKTQLPFFQKFSRVLVPLLSRNIELQLAGGAEVVMIFDTSAGELDPLTFEQSVVPAIEELARLHPDRIGYYSKGTQPVHLEKLLVNRDLAGVGVDHRWRFAEVLRGPHHGFVQGNFDQALLFTEGAEFDRQLERWLSPIRDLSVTERAGWVCGLGHGVLPKTPEKNVRRFVSRVREVFKA